MGNCLPPRKEFLRKLPTIPTRPRAVGLPCPKVPSPRQSRLISPRELARQSRILGISPREFQRRQATAGLEPKFQPEPRQGAGTAANRRQNTPLGKSGKHSASTPSLRIPVPQREMKKRSTATTIATKKKPTASPYLSKPVHFLVLRNDFDENILPYPIFQRKLYTSERKKHLEIKKCL